MTGLAETVPSISNVKAYAQIVQEKYLVRQLMGVAKDILQDAGDEPDADLLLENAEQRIYVQYPDSLRKPVPQHYARDRYCGIIQNVLSRMPECRLQV